LPSDEGRNGDEEGRQKEWYIGREVFRGYGISPLLQTALDILKYAIGLLCDIRSHHFYFFDLGQATAAACVPTATAAPYGRNLARRNGHRRRRHANQFVGLALLPRRRAYVTVKQS